MTARPVPAAPMSDERIQHNVRGWLAFLRETTPLHFERERLSKRQRCAVCGKRRVCYRLTFHTPKMQGVWSNNPHCAEHPEVGQP